MFCTNMLSHDGCCVCSLKQNGAELQGHRLGDRDDQGFTEWKNCEEAIPKGAGSPDSVSFLEGAGSSDNMMNSGVLAPVSYLVKEAESVPGVIGDEPHKVTKRTVSVRYLYTPYCRHTVPCESRLPATTLSRCQLTV